jgi:hypothetical protein
VSRDDPAHLLRRRPDQHGRAQVSARDSLGHQRVVVEVLAQAAGRLGVPRAEDLDLPEPALCLPVTRRGAAIKHLLRAGLPGYVHAH